MQTHTPKTASERVRVTPHPITTQRLVLKTLSKADAPTFFNYRSTPEVVRFQLFHPTSIEDALSFIGRATSDFNVEGTWHQYGIFLQGTLIGDIGVHFLVRDDNACEIGYTIDPAYQRRGYAREAVRAIVSLLFQTLKKEHVFAVVEVNNIASVGLLRSLGFVETRSPPVDMEHTQPDDLPARTAREICFELSADRWHS